jgi:hypothetical protein
VRAIQAKAAVLLMMALIVGGCGSGAGSPAASSGPGAATGTVAAGAPAITIKDFGYGAPMTVPPGAVTADRDQTFDVDVQGSGGTATFTAPSAPGSYPYHCTYHPNMRGTLIVK